MAKAVRQHRLLGGTVIAAGLLRAAELATAFEVLAVLWPLAALAAAVQLLLYREPEGAYETGGNHGAHSQAVSLIRYAPSGAMPRPSFSR